MMQALYLLAILVSAGCMGLVDWRYRLFAPRVGRAKAVILTAGVALVFFAADCVGIAAGIFTKGASPWMTGVELFPHMPLEEIAFLLFFAYVSFLAAGWAALTGEKGR
jgi:lycopene cyclase domain-containing protein